MSLLQSKPLLAALYASTKPLRLVPLRGPTADISVERAILLALKGNYTGKVRDGRVVKITEQVEAAPARDDRYRAGLPILQPSIQWIRRVSL